MRTQTQPHLKITEAFLASERIHLGCDSQEYQVRHPLSVGSL